MPTPGAAAEVLPGVEAALRQAAERDADAFRAALRQAVAAAPGGKEAILRYALAAHPQRSAELLLAGLFTPPLLPPAVAGPAPGHTTNRPSALPRATAQAPDDKPEGIEEKGPWNGTVVLGATVRTGNTDNAGTTGEVTVAYVEGPWRHRGAAFRFRRFTNLLSWELSDTAELENETEALADRERVNNDVVLKLRIIDQLSSQISFGFQYRSDTPEDAEHTDTTARAAAVYDF